MVAAAVLSDPVPGNLGLLADADTVVLLPFTEPDTIPCSDLAGVLEDLAEPALGVQSTADATVAWASSVSRYFESTGGLSAGDKAGKSSLLTRDVSIQAIIAIDHSNGQGAANTWLALRGTDVYTAAGATEYTAYGLKMQIDPSLAGAGEVKVAWTWQDLAGVIFLDTYASFTAQHGEFFLLTCTRRWVSTTSVVVRYYVGDQLLVERTVVSGEIGGATTGSFLVGPNWFGWLDELKVVEREMSAEEIRATWARIVTHQPGGVAALRGLAPPGVPWSRSESSDVARLLKAAGQAVGYATAKAHELRETFLPAAAYRDVLARWERLVGLQSRAQVALDTRRARVVSRLERDNGYSPPKIKDVLSTPFALTVADIELLEFAPTITDDFAALNDERWRAEPAAAWSIVAGELQLNVAAAADMRFDPASYFRPYHCRTPVDVDDDLVAQVKLSTYWAALPSTAIVGLFLADRAATEAFWFGVKNDGGTRKLGYVSLKDGVLGAFQTLANPSSDVAYYLRVTKLSASGLGWWRLSWSTTSFAAGASTTDVSGLIDYARDVGVAGMATATALASGLTATFDDFLVRAPQSRRAFHWYAYRDPGLPGDHDMLTANRLVDTLKPAHTDAAAITSKSVLCDDVDAGCDLSPLGGV